MADDLRGWQPSTHSVWGANDHVETGHPQAYIIARFYILFNALRRGEKGHMLALVRRALEGAMKKTEVERVLRPLSESQLEALHVALVKSQLGDSLLLQLPGGVAGYLRRINESEHGRLAQMVGQLLKEVKEGS